MIRHELETEERTDAAGVADQRVLVLELADDLELAGRGRITGLAHAGRRGHEEVVAFLDVDILGTQRNLHPHVRRVGRRIGRGGVAASASTAAYAGAAAEEKRGRQETEQGAGPAGKRADRLQEMANHGADYITTLPRDE